MPDVAGLQAGAITVADLYREMTGVRADIGRALERLAVADALDMHRDRQLADHERRIRVLDSFRWKALGAATALGAAGGAAVSLLTGH